MSFIRDSFNELSHVVWPTKKEARTYMLYTVGVIVVMSVILLIFGMFFKTGLKETKQFINPNSTPSFEFNADQIQNIANTVNSTAEGNAIEITPEALPTEENTETPVVEATTTEVLPENTEENSAQS